MYIKELVLRNFRNYEELKVEFDRNYNIIYGNNAQGKTNIIEAIFLCASGRSHRTSRDIELVKNGNNGFYVNIEIEKNEKDLEIEIFFDKNDKKKIKINEIPVKKIGSLMGNLNAVIFSPEDLFIVKEGPSVRRRFLDITISQLKPSYFYDLQQYSKILLQRNMLLKQIIGKRELYGSLDIWNDHLSKTGSRIIKTRNEFLKKLSEMAKIRHFKLTNEKEDLIIKYVPSFNIDDVGTEELEKLYLKVLEASTNKDLQKCVTSYGPHRDDYDIILNGMSSKQYGSQGQQRTSVLSMKLSEVDIIKEDTGDYPVLLLDDVMSELDLNRQKYLFENIGNIQTFITCTDKNSFSSNEIIAKYYNIINGNIYFE